MRYVIGMDVGTSGTKTILFNENGEIMNVSHKSYHLNQISPVMVEQDPHDWAEAALSTLKEIVCSTNVPYDSIVSIGLSGQMHGLVLLDENGVIIRPSIIWCDQRSYSEVKELSDTFGDVYFIDTTGNLPQVGFTLAKLLWVKHHEPHNYRKIRHVLLPKDYIRYVLTGKFASEYSDTSGTQWLNIKNHTYERKIIEFLELDASVFPVLFESNQITGTLLNEVADFVGLTTNTTVVGGAGDQAASALGNAINSPGDISISLGSSGVVFAQTPSIISDPLGRVQTFCHAMKDTYHVMGVTQGAGISMKWYKDELCKDLNNKESVYKAINNEINLVKRGSNGVFFLPYLNGERSPHLDINARGVFFGLSSNTNRASLGLAVMEGVAYSLRDCFELISSMGVITKQIRLGGGGAASARWRQIIADVLNHDVYVSDDSQETGCLGVAILAAVGAKIYPSIQVATANMLRGYRCITTSDDNAFYDKAYRLYKKLYIDLKKDFLELSYLEIKN